MEWKIPEFHENLEVELGCHFTDLQVFNYGEESHLHHECDWKPECHLPQTKPSAQRISQWYGIAEGTLSFDFWSHKKVDHADTELGTGLWWTENYVWGTVAGIESGRDTIWRTEFFVCPRHASACAVIYKTRLKAYQKATSPIIIIEERYL